MGMWDGIETAEVFQKGQYIKPGVYDFAVKAFKAFEGQNGETFVAEFHVLTSRGQGANEVGTTASMVRTFETKEKATMSHSTIIELVLALMGKDPGSEREQDAIRPQLRGILEAACGEENALEGARVHCEAFTIVTKKKKQDFTKCSFTPYKEAA